MWFCFKDWAYQDICSGQAELSAVHQVTRTKHRLFPHRHIMKACTKKDGWHCPTCDKDNADHKVKAHSDPKRHMNRKKWKADLKKIKERVAAGLLP